jgi:hypothetical protein
MKKTIWQPLLLGTVLGLLAGTASATDLSFLTPGITDSAIGFFVTLFLLAAAFGGPLAGAIAPILWVIITASYGSPEMVEALSSPDTYWSNLIALSTFTALVGFAYRLIFERVKMPLRLLPWAGIVITYYVITLPSAIIPQHYISGEPGYEILPAILASYKIYFPQAIFDIFFTSLVFIALSSRYLKPLWIPQRPVEKPMNDKV